MITYKQSGLEVKVYLDGSPVGMIRMKGKGFRYIPRAGGARCAGETLVSVEAVKKTLEATS